MSQELVKDVPPPLNALADHLERVGWPNAAKICGEAAAEIEGLRESCGRLRELNTELLRACEAVGKAIDGFKWKAPEQAWEELTAIARHHGPTLTAVIAKAKGGAL